MTDSEALVEFYERVLDTSPAMIVVGYADPSRQPRFVSREFIRATGIRLDDYASMSADHWWSHVHPDDREVARRWRSSISLDGGNSPPMEYRFKTLAGWRWFSTTVSRFGGAAGDDTQIMLTSTDVTDVLGEKARTALMIEANPVAQVIFDLDSSDIEFANDALFELSGRTIEEWNGLGAPNVRAGRVGTPAEDLAVIFDAIDRALATGEVTAARRRWQHADGDTRWLDCRYRAFPDPLRPERRRVLMTAADITAQVTAEAQQRALLESAPALVTIADASSDQREYLSPEFTRFTGLTLEQYNAMSRDERLDLVHPDDRERVNASSMRFWASNGTVIEETTYRLRSVDGWRWITTQARVLATKPDGAVKKMMMTGVDIHDRVEADSFRTAVLDGTPTGITVYDLVSDRPEFVNAEFTALTGYRLDDLDALEPPAVASMIPPEDLPPVIEISLDAYRAGTVGEVRHRIRHLDGSLAWYSSRFTRFETGERPKLLVSSVEVTAQMEAETQSQTILDTSPSVILVHDPDEVITEYANPTFTKITGFDADQLNAIDRAERPSLVHPDDVAAEAEAMATALETGQAVSLTHRLATSGDGYRWMETQYQHFPDAAGLRPRRMLITSIDVTDRVEAEQLARSLLEISPITFHVYDWPARRYEWANPAFERATGHTPEILNARAAQGIEPVITVPEDLDTEFAAVRRAIETGEQTTVRHRYVRADGVIRSFDSQITALPDRLGEPSGRVLVSSIDITDRLEAEALSETVLMSSPAPTVVFDASTRKTLFANPAFTAATGHTAESLNEMPLDEMLDLTPADQRALVDAAIEQTRTTGEIASLERLYRGTDGVARWFDSRFLRLPIGDGNEIVITAIETTERRAAEVALEAERAQLERANRDLQEFVYIASHDLQEPLRTLSAYTGLLTEELAGRAEGELSEDGAASLRFINEGAARMRDLVRGLLDYSRIGSDRFVELIGVDHLAGAAIDDLGDQITREQATVTSASLPTVRADATEVRLVLQNLISNAIKFRSPDRAPTVHVDVDETEQTWKFTVTDNGIGIAPEHVDRIFSIFQRLHSRTAYEGTGIGLAHAKRAVENHGGEIGVDSVLGHGSTFWFTIPKEPTP